MSALERFKCHVEIAKPRQILKSSPRTWLIFTDACYEPTATDWKCGLGGVIYDPAGRLVQSFSFSLSDAQIRALGGDQKKTIIFEAELSALVVAASLWQPLFGGCPTVFYVDNNSARDVATSGCGGSTGANKLLDFLLEVEMNSGAFAWYSRVPSPSDPADEPSRGSELWLKGFGHSVVSVSSWLDVIFSKLIESSAKGGV